MKKRMVAILLTLCLALSLAACSSGGSSEQSSQSQESSQTQEPSQSAEPSTAEESSEPEKESSEPEETETTPTEESSSEEEPTEEAISEDTLNYYGLTSEEFVALRESIKAHINSEWDVEDDYLDDKDFYDLVNKIRSNMTEDFMKDEIVDEFINSELSSYTDLGKKRVTILTHAFNDWAAQQSIDYDTYFSA